MKIEVHNPGNLPTIDYRKLNPLQGNLKDFHEREYEKLKKSLSEFGWVYPFFVWFNPKDNLPYIMDGHGRHRFATREGIQPFELPYVQVEAENLTQAKKLLLVATSQYQRITQEGFDEFTFDLEDDWLKETVNFDGVFSDVEIPEEEPEAHEDNYEAPDEIKTDIVLGDLFEIGEHRLLCGDSTDSDSVARLMDGDKADMVFTSPPYNASTSVGFAGSSLKNKNLYLNNKEDDKTPFEYINFTSDVFNTIKTIASENMVILYNINYNKNSPDLFIDVVNKGREAFNLVETIIWEKSMAISLAGSNLTRIFEFIFVFYNGNDKPKLNKTKTNECIKNLWKISNIGANQEFHKACFPIKLVEQGINIYAKNDAILYEPFTGSGSTMVAAHQLNRKCYGMELDPKYCQVIVDRMLKLDPTLEVKRNGEPFIQKSIEITNE